MGDLKKAVSHLEGQTFIDQQNKIGVYFSGNYIEIFDSNEDEIIAEISYNAVEEDTEEEEEE